MDDQFTNINDETRLDSDEQSNNKPEENIGSENKAEDSSKVKSTIKSMGMGGGFGVIAGVIGAIGYNAFRPAPVIENPQPVNPVIPNIPVQELENIEETKLAHSPNDNMSFNEAFATARGEVGAHGVFEWRGNVYGTYYAEEWNSFSDEYKAQFSNHDWKTEFANDPEHLAQHQETPQDVTVNTNSFGDHEIKVDENGQEYISLVDAVTGDEVRITPDDLKYAVLDDYGDVVVIITEDAYNEIINESWEITDYCVFDENGNIIGYTGLAYDIPDDDNVAILISSDDIISPDYVDEEVVEIDGQYDIEEYDDDKADYLANNDLPDYANDEPVDDFMA